MELLPASYDAATVVASVLIAIYASYVALDLARRVRASDRTVAQGWLIAGSVLMGSGVWAMHFVGMEAFRLPIALGYSPIITFLSWLAAVMVSGVALGVASGAHLTLGRLVMGAGSMGAGICLMHYTGMAALDMLPGIIWDYRLVGASAVIAVAASAVALLIFFWLRTRKESQARWWQIGAAVAMGVAISGMHYTGMAAAAFPVGSICLTANALSGDELGLIVGTAAVGLLTMTLLTSVLDARMQTKAVKLSNSLQQANDELQRIAYRDALTQLPNRLVFEDHLEEAIAHCQREHTRFALLFIDLDGFKPINDTLGHSAGDELLRAVARRLRGVARHADTLARVGGDEFLMLLEGHPDAAAAAQVATRVREALQQPFLLHDQEVRLSCSIGIAFYPEHGPRGKLIANADAAMYAAKRAGGGGHCFFEAHMDAGSAEQLELQRDLRMAVERGELELHYQPKVDSQNRQVRGVEALLRWKHPTRGMISPGVFIPIAERFGLIGTLGNWVIDEACRQMQAWQAQGLLLRVAINLSVHQLRQEDLVPRLQAALSRNGIDPSRLTCEITESVAMEDVSASMLAFESLGQLGVQISIDDFGTGYSSLSYLRKLQVQQLKIDRSFVKDLESDGDAHAIVEAVLRLAHALGLEVVAEGVETSGQHRILADLGCDKLQGFYFAKPMPANVLALWAMGDEPREISFSDSQFDPAV